MTGDADFVALIPARLASARLPDKPLADIAGVPMVVHVARRAALATDRVVVAADHPRIVEACAAHGVVAILTRHDHPSGSDRLAEACEQLGLPDDTLVVNVQGDEPLIAPALIGAVARHLQHDPNAAMSTAAHPIAEADEFRNPNVVKVVLDHRHRALYFSRAPIAFARDGDAGWGGPGGGALTAEAWAQPLRHIGIYGYRAGFLRGYPRLPVTALERTESLEQLRVLWHGHAIGVHITASAPAPGVDTPEDLARVRALMVP